MMDFDEILSQWENNKIPEATKKKIKKKKESLSMSSFLDLYPPDDTSGKAPEEKQTIRQKKRNYRRMAPQEVLDLHGFKVVSALVELDDFLKRCKKRHIEKVLIIHGKGLHSPEGDSILRTNIRNELKKLPCIGEIGYPSEREGGAGATWAIINY